MNKQNSAVKTLESLGYTYKGGELWKPPIGKEPDFNLIDKLHARIKEFESDKYINEIKAQGADAVRQFLRIECGYLSDIDIDLLYDFAEELRNNHE